MTRINELGGIQAIVISHPHFFATNLHWAEAFGCPVFLSADDSEWAVRTDEKRQTFWEGRELDPLGGGGGDNKAGEANLVAIKTGGHFPGSSVLWWKSAKRLLVADSVQVVPSGIYHVGRPPGTVSFTFMWSYPNMVCSLIFLGDKRLMNRFRSLRKRCITSGKPSSIPILTMRMAGSLAWMSGEPPGSACWRVRRSSSGLWAILIMLSIKRCSTYWRHSE